MTVIGFIYFISWGNPYTSPPEGKPRDLFAMYCRCGHPGEGARTPPEVETAIRPLIGSGYMHSVAAVMPDPKPWSDERKFAYRRKILENRIRKKYPMFADELIAEAHAKRPDYYGVQHDSSAVSNP